MKEKLPPKYKATISQGTGTCEAIGYGSSRRVALMRAAEALVKGIPNAGLYEGFSIRILPNRG